jgi:purine nucleosidase
LNTRKIILDCDPGHDDAIAMMLAYGNPSIDLLAVTTVGGNQTLEKVTKNALAVATMIRMKDVPIAAGCSRPLVNEIEVAPDIHGESGMEGPALPEIEVELADGHAVDLIIDTIMNNPPKTVTLVPTGALTNIAMAARKEPKIVDRVQEVVLMGGGYNVGNWSAVAEFNIIVDPEAAQIVFSAGWEVVMVGLDLTHQALALPEVFESIEGIGTKTSQFVLELLEFFKKAYKEAQGFDAPPVHDPCTLAYLIDPAIVTTKRVPVAVELTGALTRGMTVADFRYPIPENVHTSVATKLDNPAFWELVYDALRRIG